LKKVTIRIADELCQQIRIDLLRPHNFAYERVGFVIGKSKELQDGKELVIITEYIPIANEHYIEDDTVGARIDSNAIRIAMQIVMNRKCSMFHVHAHFGNGTPLFSSTDLEELPNIAAAMINANPLSVHGALLINEDAANAIVMMKSSRGEISLEKITRVGYPMKFNKLWYQNVKFDKNRYDRQSFLGKWSQHIISEIRIGIIGLGGGGSHLVQQLAHLGIQNYVIFDFDIVDESNLNRLVSGKVSDAKSKSKKTDVAFKQITGLQPKANVKIVNSTWQENSYLLQECDVIFGAVDSFAARRDIELECRRYLIPYIDIGMDVCIVGSEPPRLFGQIILSLPGKPCMHCIGYLTEKLLAKEASKYGDAGKKPQVVWSNGVLASNAIGIFVDMITGWSKKKEIIYYQEYDGNNITLTKSYRLDYLRHGHCIHFPLRESGPINWT